MGRIYILAILAGTAMTVNVQAGNWHCAEDFGYCGTGCDTGGCNMHGSRPLYMTYSCNRAAGLWDTFCADSHVKRFGCGGHGGCGTCGGCGGGLFAPRHAFPCGCDCMGPTVWNSCGAKLNRMRCKLACMKPQWGCRPACETDCGCADFGCADGDIVEGTAPAVGGCPSCGKTVTPADSQPTPDANADPQGGLDVKEEAPPVPATESTTSWNRQRVPIQPASQSNRFHDAF